MLKALIFTPLLGLLISCQHKLETDALPTVETVVGCDPNTVYFVNDILPIISSSCAYSGCHDPITRQEGYDFSTYASMMNSNTIKPGNSSNSKFVKVLTETGNDRMPPLPKAGLTADQIAEIRKWIDQGAINNECLDCDSSNVTFAGNVWPIVQSNCKGCHSGANPEGGISITNYSQLNSLVQNGNLIGAITSQQGFVPMPKNGKLTDCEIGIIKIWIKNGAQND